MNPHCRSPPSPFDFEPISNRTEERHMKNYQSSDYALNKYSSGIVYHFADEIVEVTLENYLTENPDKSEADFRALKELSDAIYLEQVNRL
jgi:hypothetical protein